MSGDKKITVLAVRAGGHRVELIDPGLKSMQALVGGLLEHVTLRGRFAGLSLWVNDEGRLQGLPLRNCPVWTHEQIAGDYFIARGEGSLTDSDLVLLLAAFAEGA